MRLVCHNCKKKSHKILENKYKNYDLKCKVCLKPSMNKNCIGCSECKHMYHAKCLNFTLTDVNIIEKVCSSYTCMKCLKKALPMCNEEDTIKKDKISKSKHKAKSCMLCTSSISRKKYYCKHIIYNGKQSQLCINCSKKGLNNKVRDTELLEFKDCSICKKIVKFEAIYCNECHHWIHPACEKIGKNELRRFGEFQ